MSSSPVTALTTRGDILRRSSAVFLTRHAPAVLVLLACAVAVAQAPPSADTMIVSSKPSQNFGSNSILAVQKGVNSLIQFNLAGVPANATLQRASLRLYVDAVATPGSFDVYALENAWSESQVNFQNGPALGASVTGGKPLSITRATQNQFILVDITALAQEWINGGTPNNGLALALTGTTGCFSFDSKESLFTSHEPELELVLNTTPGPQGAAGPQGPPGVQGPAGPQGRSRTEFSLLEQVNLIAAQVIWAKLVGRLAKVLRELLDEAQIVADGGGGVVAALEFFEHHFA